MMRLIKKVLKIFSFGKCPQCGSNNTGQSTYADWCNDCDWFQGY